MTENDQQPKSVANRGALLTTMSQPLRLRWYRDEAVNLSPAVAELLRNAGHDAGHVNDFGLGTANDEAILEHALREGQAIVGADSDSTTMLALRGLRAPSLVLLRSADHLKPTAQFELLIENLPTIADYLSTGAVVSLNPNHLRVRELPI